MPIHLCKGDANNKICFVLSTPGKAEGKAGCPVAGETGDNMNAILKILNKSDPVNFPSTDRYHYLITNASTKVMHAGVGNRKTEDKDSNITDQKNLDRIQRDVANCEIVILCGDKAHLLEANLSEKSIIKTIHLGNRGLRKKYPNIDPQLKGINTGKDRDIARLRLCAESILEQLLNYFPASSINLH